MAPDLGKVGIRMRGDWSSSATYEVLDAVSYNGALYIAKQAVPENTLPTNATYWQAALTASATAYTFNLSSSFSGTTSISRVGDLIFLNLNITGTFTANANHELGSLPSELITSEAQFEIGTISSTGITGIGEVIIRANSANVLMIAAASGTKFQATITYVKK